MCYNDTDSFRKFLSQNSVKQGGVLSPIKFNDCMDVLLLSHKTLDLGCHIADLLMGALCQAADFVIIVPVLYYL